MRVHTVPGKVTVDYDAETNAIIDTWTTYAISLGEFKDAVLEKGLPFGKARGVTAWIVDSSQAHGAFSPEIQDFIGSIVVPAFAKCGVRFLVTITSQISVVTKFAVRTYQARRDPPESNWSKSVASMRPGNGRRTMCSTFRASRSRRRYSRPPSLAGRSGEPQ